MSEQVQSENTQEVTQEAPQLSEREIIEQEAIARYRESQKSEAEKAEGMPEGYNEDGTEKEELIAGKFKSQEDLLKAYQELESKLGAPKEEVKEETTTEPVQEETTQAPTNFDKYAEEYNTNKELSEASYAELEKMGFSKSDVDRYIQGQEAYAGNFTNEIYGVAGGQEAYTEVVTWAADNIDQAVIKDYNDALANLDTANAKRHLEYMTMKMQQSQPKQVNRLEGESGGTGIQPFSDKNEWQKAQTNRLYGKDAKYTNMVDKRYLAARKKGLI